jgi:ankyrin repeat protein
MAGNPLWTTGRLSTTHRSKEPTVNAIANTPLQTAVVGGNVEGFTLVLEHGPNLNLKDASGLTALDLVMENGASEMFDLIQKKSTDRQ